MADTINIRGLMSQINDWLKPILVMNYVGVYFHGSLRLGSFNPQRSDVDFVIVVKEKLDYFTKSLIWNKLYENIQLFPPRGFDFCVVLEQNCMYIQHPTPYEMIGSANRNGEVNCIADDAYTTDPKIVSYFGILNVRNDACDFGKLSSQVFAPVPRQYMIDSCYNDTLECLVNITSNPIYCVLNLCRFCALLRDGLILSKYDGGVWALQNLNSAYPDIIVHAMEDYISGTGHQYDTVQLTRFTQEVMQLVNGLMGM